MVTGNQAVLLELSSVLVAFNSSFEVMPGTGY